METLIKCKKLGKLHAFLKYFFFQFTSQNDDNCYHEGILS